MNEHSPLTVLKGIGEKSAKQFEKAGIHTLGDLIRYYPARYELLEAPGTIEDCADGRKVAVCGFVGQIPVVRFGGGMRITSAKIITDNEEVEAVWFNMPYLRSQVLPGKKYVFRGVVKMRGRRKVLTQAAVFDPEEYEQMRGTLQPVYPLVRGLTRNMLVRAVRQLIQTDACLATEYLPEDIRRRYSLAELGFSLQRIHFPGNENELQQARNRLVFDEFFIFILALRRMKEERGVFRHDWTLAKAQTPGRIIRELPYRLTGAQMRVWEEVERDLQKQEVCARLIQGDVGSGKTIIAFLSLLMAAENGAQGALMVPTEVLARQHFEAYEKLRQSHDLPYQAVLLTGSMKASEKKAARSRIESGEVSIVIGTHALIQEKVKYSHLALVITDEQHRFGVRQREQLGDKGDMPHTIVMSATPIPRTLAVILYGDLDVSVIDEMPADRLKVKNCVVGPKWRPKAYSFIEKEVRQGHQAYVICPLTEESELMEGENVEDYAEKLRNALPGDIRVEYLHGKMKPAVKNDIMERFLRNEINVLVSTTVIEVGVNVPNATVMMIENADHFGLAQLHQLRGRVGRGSEQSYCILVDSEDREKPSVRLEVLNRTNDGFEIAAEDLKLRGPGEILGVRQSGELAFAIGDVFADSKVLTQAAEAASEILQKDAVLSAPEHCKLLNKLQLYMNEGLKKLNI